jgi:hypothetical protein
MARFILFVIFCIFSIVISQDINQVPVENNAVNIIPLDEKSSDQRWLKFKSVYNKTYSSKQEEDYRYINFRFYFINMYYYWYFFSLSGSNAF